MRGLHSISLLSNRIFPFCCTDCCSPCSWWRAKPEVCAIDTCCLLASNLMPPGCQSKSIWRQHTSQESTIDDVGISAGNIEVVVVAGGHVAAQAARLQRAGGPPVVRMGGGIVAEAHHIAAPAVAQNVLHLAARPARVSMRHGWVCACMHTPAQRLAGEILSVHYTQDQPQVTPS